ncbi:MAG: hypothetical protein ABIH76_04000 [Candidatus Bathyarchaeota archaeon]
MKWSRGGPARRAIHGLLAGEADLRAPVKARCVPEVAVLVELFKIKCRLTEIVENE